MSCQRPFIVGVGGTARPASSSERALRVATDAAAALGAETEIISASDLNFPMYDPYEKIPAAAATRFIETIRRADGVIIATPAYHGGLSGLLKNALDYLQALAEDPIPYLQDKAVGCIVSAAGWQAAAAALTSLRSTVHALRGWPTPLGVIVNSTLQPFAADGRVLDAKVGGQLALLGKQVARFRVS